MGNILTQQRYVVIAGHTPDNQPTTINRSKLYVRTTCIESEYLPSEYRIQNLSLYLYNIHLFVFVDLAAQHKEIVKNT
jgi:hypothetical protein